MWLAWTNHSHFCLAFVLTHISNRWYLSTTLLKFGVIPEALWMLARFECDRFILNTATFLVVTGGAHFCNHIPIVYFYFPSWKDFFLKSNHFNLGLRGWFRPQKPAIERGVCRLFLFFFNLHCSLDNQFLACCPEVLRPFADWWDCRDGRTGACCSLLLLFVALEWRTCLMASASRIFHFRSLLKDAWQITLADRRLPASRRPKNQLRRRAQGAGS